MEKSIRVSEYQGDGTEWNAFLARCPDSTNYHQYEWKQVIERSFGHKPYYLVARNGSGEICGILPLVHMKSSLFGSFLVSLPFFNYGGVISDDDDTAGSLFNASRDFLEVTGADHSEFRHLTLHGKGLVTKQHKVTMILDLEQHETTQWQSLNAKVRNQVRKAEKSGLQTITGHLELLDGFYEVFCRNMRDLGTPVYSKSFFRNILGTFPESTSIISVTLDNKTIASGILTWFRDTLEVPWASSLKNYREFCPNNLLYWEAIRFAIRNGSTKFDFGRSTVGEGTYRFKKQWGAMPVQLYWQYQLDDGVNLPELNPKNPKFEMAIRIWQKLPVHLTNLLGPHIVRNLP